LLFIHRDCQVYRNELSRSCTSYRSNSQRKLHAR
jgi:hypothetical protein